MSYVRIDNGNNLLLQVVLSDGNATMFPQAKVYSSAGTLLTTINLTNVSGGLYKDTSYTPATGAEYMAVYSIFQDSGHTIAANYLITSDVFDVRDIGPSSVDYTTARAVKIDNLDATISSRAAAATALSTAQWTNTRAGNLDNLDAAVSTRATQTSVTAIPTNPLLTTDSRLNNLDATISSRAPSSTALSTVQWTTARAGNLDNLDATISSRAAAATALSTVQWTNTRAGNLDNLDAAVSTRAAASTALSTTNWTTTRANLLDNLSNLDATVSTRATQTSVSAIPTNPLLTTDARLNNLDAAISTRLSSSDTRINNLDVAVSSRASQTSVTQIQNNTLAAFIVPDVLVIPDTGSTPYNFYAYFYNDAGSPIDPDSQIVNVTIKNSGGTILAGPTAMTRTGVGIYSYQTIVLSTATQLTEYVFFDYSVNSVALEQVRATNLSVYQSDLDILLGRLTATRASNLDNLDALISSRAAAATAVSNVDYTNTRAAKIDNLDAAISTRAAAATALSTAVWTGARASNLDSIDATISSRAPASTALSTAQWTNTRAGLIDNLDIAVSTRAPSSTALSTVDWSSARAAKIDNLDTNVSSRASQTSVNTANTNILAIEGQTGQLSFTGGNVNANAASITDKTGYSLTTSEHTLISGDVWDTPIANHLTAGSTGAALNSVANSETALTPTDYQNIANFIWDEPISGHTNPNTFGERNNTFITQSMANNLTNLDVTISSRAPSATAISSNTLTVGRITNLDYLNVAVSSRAAASDLAPIAAQTALIPAVPATQAAVLAIPTNPLLTNDGRLSNLDVATSTRAAPSDLAPLATTADLDTFEASLATAVHNVQISADEAARPSDITSAVAPLATSAEVAAVQSTVDSISGVQVTPADIWDYSTRGLTEPVDTTDDLTPLATTAQLTASQAAIILAVDYWQSKLTVAIDPTTDQMTMIAWLEQNGQALTTSTQASVNVYDGTNALVLAVGPDDMTNSQGTFTFTRANASLVFAANNTYTCEILIVNNSNSYRGITPITVF